MKKRKENSIAFNFVMNALLTVSSILFPLITFPYASRVLLPEGIGKVSLATSLVTYFSRFAQLGIPTYGIRACARVRDDREKLTRTAHELLIINLIMTVVAYGAFFVVLGLPRLRQERTLYLTMSATILLTSLGMEWLYKALEQYSYITMRSIIFKFVALAALFLLVHTREDYVIYGGITILAASASNIFNFLNAHKYIDMKPIGNYHIVQHIKPALIFFSMVGATMIYTNLDTVMLGFMKTDVDVGYYNAAMKVKTTLVSLVTSLGAVLLPRLSYYVEHHKEAEFRRISQKSIDFIFLIAPSLTLFFILLAGESIYFLSGPEYSSSVLPMKVLMLTLPLVGLTHMFGIQILVPRGQEKAVLYSYLTGAVVNLILNTVLIPRYAAVGAAVGTLAAELAVLIVQIAALKQMALDLFRGVPYGKLIPAMVLGSLGALWTKKLGLEAFGCLAVSAVCFFGIYFVSLLVMRETVTMEVVNKVLRRGKKQKKGDS